MTPHEARRLPRAEETASPEAAASVTGTSPSTARKQMTATTAVQLAHAVGISESAAQRRLSLGSWPSAAQVAAVYRISEHAAQHRLNHRRYNPTDPFWR